MSTMTKEEKLAEAIRIARQPPVIAYTPQPEIDHVATGKAFKTYRTAHRVTLEMAADRIKSPTGSPMTRTNLWNYEAGKQQWSEKLFAECVAAVDFYQC